MRPARSRFERSAVPFGRDGEGKKRRRKNVIYRQVTGGLEIKRVRRITARTYNNRLDVVDVIVTAITLSYTGVCRIVAVVNGRNPLFVTMSYVCFLSTVVDFEKPQDRFNFIFECFIVFFFSFFFLLKV